MHTQQRPRKKRVSMLIYYPLTALVCAIGIGGFVLFYQGGGASSLPRASVVEAEPDPASADTLSISGEQPSQRPGESPEASPVSTEGRLLPYLEGDLWGYKNTKGEVAIEAQYLRALEFDEQTAFAAIEKDGKLLYGLLTRDGNWLAQPSWSNVRPFSEKLAAVEQNEKWGFIDRMGKTVIPYSYREAGDFHCGRAAVRTASTFGYIDPDGALAIAAQFDEAGDFGSDMAFAKQNDKHYIINKIGEKIATLGAKSGREYSEGYAVIREDKDTVRFFNQKRSQVFSAFEDARSFSGGLAAVKKDGLWGFLNTAGELLIQPQFAEAGDFSQGYAAVKDESGKWGYINQSGNIAVPCEYEEAEAFLQDVAIVRKEGQTGIVTAKDKTYIPLY